MATENEKEQNKKRVAAAISRPIEYCYEAAQSSHALEYIEVLQCINDKFNGNLLQRQYFHLAEQSKRIFELNRLLLDRAADDARVNPKIKFLVQVSAKWFSTDDLTDRIIYIASQMPDNIILGFDSVTLVSEGIKAKEGFKQILKLGRVRILLDNIEYQNLSQIIGYHSDYVRIDARFIDKGDENYTEALRFLRGYFKSIKVKMAVQNVKDEIYKSYFFNNGVDACQGNGVYSAKKNIPTILKNYKLLSK